MAATPGGLVLVAINHYDMAAAIHGFSRMHMAPYDTCYSAAAVALTMASHMAEAIHTILPVCPSPVKYYAAELASARYNAEGGGARQSPAGLCAAVLATRPACVAYATQNPRWSSCNNLTACSPSCSLSFFGQLEDDQCTARHCGTVLHRVCHVLAVLLGVPHWAGAAQLSCNT